MVKRSLISGLLAIVVLSSPLWASSEKEAEALKTAEAWLQLVDTEKYAESWSRTSQFFRNAVPENSWGQSLTAFRKPLGEVLSRNVAEMTYATQLPGAPDGEYVVIQFQTSFENKASSIETVTPSLEKDGVWRVSGYFIK